MYELTFCLAGFRMSSMKKSELESQQDAGVSAESAEQDESQRQMLLHRE